MTSKQELQLLHDAAQHSIENARNVQSAIKKLNAAKKDLEIKQQQQALLELLQMLNNDLTDFQDKTTAVQEELECVLEYSNNPDNGDSGNAAQNNKSSPKTDPGKQRLRNPDDQETAYQLKARMMPQIHSQNQSLMAELILKERRDDLRAQRQKRQINYNRETNLSAKTTLQCIQSYERRTKEAERRAEALQKELDQKQSRNSDSDRHRQTAYPTDDKPQSSATSQNRINDLDKKNQLLLDENQDQQREIQRLKRDNAELIKKAKHAEQDRNQMTSQLSTSEMARKDLLTRLNRQKSQYDRLSRSLTRQSSDWIEAKKQQHNDGEEWRWKNVGHAAPHGSFERTHSHPVPRNTDQPRNMYPATKYAQPVA